MATTIIAPVDWIESVGRLRFPAKADQRLQSLMDRNTQGQLAAGELAELEALAELSEQIAIVRAGALQLLGERPFGLAAGEFVVPDDFDAPLPDAILDLFEGPIMPDSSDAR